MLRGRVWAWYARTLRTSFARHDVRSNALRLHLSTAALAGAAATPETFAAAADAAAQEIEPLSDIRGSAAYKREMVRVHTRRALSNAWRASGKGGSR